jgi:hypothetical protein
MLPTSAIGCAAASNTLTGPLELPSLLAAFLLRDTVNLLVSTLSCLTVRWFLVHSSATALSVVAI